MKIHYKKRTLYFNLSFGIIWSLFFFIKLIFDRELHWTDYCFWFISLAYFGIFFYQMKYQYIRIENGLMMLNGPWGKTINLNEIKRIKKFAGDYIIKTDNKDLSINTQIIEPKSLANLNAALDRLNVEWVS